MLQTAASTAGVWHLTALLLVERHCINFPWSGIGPEASWPVRTSPRMGWHSEKLGNSAAGPAPAAGSPVAADARAEGFHHGCWMLTRSWCPAPRSLKRGLDTLAAAVGTETAAATAVVPCSSASSVQLLFACFNSEQTLEAMTAMTRPHCAVAWVGPRGSAWRTQDRCLHSYVGSRLGCTASPRWKCLWFRTTSAMWPALEVCPHPQLV